MPAENDEPPATPGPVQPNPTTTRPSDRRPRQSGAGDLACLQAGGADVEPLRGLADDGVHGLDVRVPATGGAPVGVRNRHPEAGALAADVAHRGHGKLLKVENERAGQEIRWFASMLLPCGTSPQSTGRVGTRSRGRPSRWTPWAP